MKKVVNIYVGTELSMTSPTHPLSCAIATKRMVDKIYLMPDSKYEFKTNSIESVKVFQLYGRHKGLTIQFYINGKKSTFKSVLEDFARADEYIQSIVEEVTQKQ